MLRNSSTCRNMYMLAVFIITMANNSHSLLSISLHSLLSHLQEYEFIGEQYFNEAIHILAMNAAEYHIFAESHDVEYFPTLRLYPPHSKNYTNYHLYTSNKRTAPAVMQWLEPLYQSMKSNTTTTGS